MAGVHPSHFPPVRPIQIRAQAKRAAHKASPIKTNGANADDRLILAYALTCAIERY